MANPDPSPPRRHQYLDIHPERPRRWLGWITYLLLVGCVGAVLAWFFQYFTQSWLVSVGVVVFMLAYMAVMAWWASRNPEWRRRQEA